MASGATMRRSLVIASKYSGNASSVSVTPDENDPSRVSWRQTLVIDDRRPVVSIRQTLARVAPTCVVMSLQIAS